MSTVPNRLYQARSPEGVEIWIPESEMPGGGGGGSGDVVGPGSSTDNALALFDGITGKLLKDGGSLSAELAAANVALLINTDGDLGRTIFVGSIDPAVDNSPIDGDVWIQQ